MKGKLNKLQDPFFKKKNLPTNLSYGPTFLPTDGRTQPARSQEEKQLDMKLQGVTDETKKDKDKRGKKTMPCSKHSK